MSFSLDNLSISPSIPPGISLLIEKKFVSFLQLWKTTNNCRTPERNKSNEFKENNNNTFRWLFLSFHLINKKKLWFYIKKKKTCKSINAKKWPAIEISSCFTVSNLLNHLNKWNLENAVLFIRGKMFNVFLKWLLVWSFNLRKL